MGQILEVPGPGCGVPRAFRDLLKGWGSAGIFRPPYCVFGGGSWAPPCGWLPVRPIGRLSAPVGVVYMYVGSCDFMAPVVYPDRSLSPRAVGGSYSRRGMYSSGSVSRPPGMAAPYLLTPIPPASPKIPFLVPREELVVVCGPSGLVAENGPASLKSCIALYCGAVLPHASARGGGYRVVYRFGSGRPLVPLVGSMLYGRRSNAPRPGSGRPCPVSSGVSGRGLSG